MFRGGEGGGREVQGGGDVYTRLIHAEVQQKPAQHCEAIILQLKISQLEKKEKKKVWGGNGGSGGSNEILPLQLPIPPAVPEMSSNSHVNFQEGAGGGHPDGKHSERRQGEDDNQ